MDETELISLHYENRALLPDNDAKDIKKKSPLVLRDNHRSCGPFALKDPELTIIPDSCIYQVPLGALADGGDRFVSETFRIRIVPSLMTLRLIRDSPPQTTTGRQLPLNVREALGAKIKTPGEYLSRKKGRSNLAVLESVVE